ncbi:MAG: CAP domain-containing protein [Deltaproteobacteria bacterium]|jgi:uncharacterized protein YkwD|nr:CAP domain-containing protein [Deltaproteobacteria bacterium]
MRTEKKIVFVLLAGILLWTALLLRHNFGSKPSLEGLSEANFWPSGAEAEKDFASELFELINKTRQSANLKPLAANSTLTRIAGERAAELAQLGRATLSRPDGSDWTTLLAANGLNNRVAGENHSVGNLSPSLLLESFLKNEKDSHDFLFEGYALLGVGAVRTPAGLNYVACLFLTQEIDPLNYAREVAVLVNLERKKEGLKPLTSNRRASRAAMIRADEVRLKPAHVRLNGEPWNSVLKEVGLDVVSAGENIAVNQRDPKEVMADWMSSPGHRRNILRPTFTAMGVGVRLTPEGRPTWSQIFIQE